MKKVIPGFILAAVLGSVAFAGPFIGTEIVPHQEMGGLPYLALGWDGGWIMTTVATLRPFYLDSVYMLNVSPMFNITPSFRVGGGLAAWVYTESWEITYATWSANVGVVGKYQGIIGFVRFHVPLSVPSNAPFLGAWYSFGFVYDLFPLLGGQ